MPRRIRNQYAVLALESTYGTAPTFVGTDVILMKSFKMTVAREGVRRDLMQSYFGASEELVGIRRAEVEIVVELAGSGTAGTAPMIGRMFQACGMAQTITAGNRVEYTPISTGQQSVAINFSNDGARYVLRGMMGTCKLDLTAYQIPTATFTLTGFDLNAQVAAVVAPDFTNWKRPQVISDANSSGFKIGGTYATGSISSGTALISRGVTLDIGNDVQHMQLVGGEQIDLTGRETTGTGIVELTATDEVQWRTDMNNNALTSLSFEHGTAVGNKFVMFIPNAQRLNNQIEPYNGRAMTSFDFRAMPLTGNDEFRLVFK